MKRVLAFFPLLVAASVWADDRADASDQMVEALGRLRMESGIALTMDGVSRADKKETPFSVTIYWVREPGSTVTKVEATYRQAGVTRQKMIADGVRLWSYWPERNEYTCSPYGNERTAQPADAVERLLRLMSLQSRGQASLPIRLLTETFGASSGTWAPWYPMAEVKATPLGFAMNSGNPLERQVSFSFSEPDDNGLRLDTVTYWETSQARNEVREVEWTMNVLHGFKPKDVDFLFVAPKGSRTVPLASSKPS